MPQMDRRRFLESASLLGVAGTVFPTALYEQVERTGEITLETIAQAEQLAGLTFTDEERALMLDGLIERLDDYALLRAVDLPNEVSPCQFFDPAPGRNVAGSRKAAAAVAWEPRSATRPAKAEDLAFSSVATLSGLLRSRQVTSVELTELYLNRLGRYDSVLHAVVTLTTERALRQARVADAELDAGRWRGPLHGIPWGAKDLLAVAGYPTTWGASPYREQMLDHDADVVRRLDEAGAVLVAKLSLGALAMGDVWFGGRTRNPWNIERGSSGSSAGPAAAVAAGLVGFAIGSETLGSIVSPSTRTGVTGHRPTFGRVPRGGAMTLSWTMDKLGPMCRSAEDCALVFSAIHGHAPGDPTSVTAAFEWPTVRAVSRLKVGYLGEAFNREYGNRDADLNVLRVLRDLGVEPAPITLPDLPSSAMLIMLYAEAGAAFDSLTRDGRDDDLTRQDGGSWPNTFRQSRFIPAVEYINASRARSLLIEQMRETLHDLDAFVAPTRGGSTLGITNLTGHPSVTFPNRLAPLEGLGASPRRNPDSITVVGNLYRDAEALTLAHAVQSATDFHRRRPPIE